MTEDKGFVVRLQEGRYCPWLICERCRQPIEDYLGAIAVWNQREEYDDGTLHCVTVLCKANGCAAKELRGPNRVNIRSQDRRDYLLWLVFNSGFKTKAQIGKEWKTARLAG